MSLVVVVLNIILRHLNGGNVVMGQVYDYLSGVVFWSQALYILKAIMHNISFI